MAAENDIAAQLLINDTNQMLAQILLEIKVTNNILIQMCDCITTSRPFPNEIGAIRESLTLTDVLNPT